jgi:glycosyltransferase involved in cell wall biosynthesis
MNKLKVLHIVGSLSIRSGVSSIVMNYYRNIDKSKVQFDFIIHSKPDITYEKEINKMDGKIYRLPNLSLKNIFPLYKAVKTFFNEKGNEYQLIHVHTPSLCIFYFPIAKKTGIKNRIAHSHNTKYSDYFFRSVRNYILTKPIKKYTTKKIACSKLAGAFLFGIKDVQNGNILILKNGIECNKFRYSFIVRNEFREKLKLKNKFVIGHIGRFNKQKNHNFLIDIFFEIYKKNNKSVLLLIGEGELLPFIRKRVEELGISNSVLFWGRSKNINELMQAMDLFLLPSLYEGLPIVGIEAQASGLPCIFSSNISDEVKVLDDVRFISLKKSASYWADEVLKIYKNYDRIDTCPEILHAGYDIKQIAKSIEEFYLNL